MWMRHSLEALPPSTGRSCMRTTFTPCRAAAIEATRPAIPPPTTQKSTLCKTCGNFFEERPISVAPCSVDCGEYSSDRLYSGIIVSFKICFY
ncbi:MAG: hypothetical protein ACTSWY_01805 [Promethearchaeota archaeon]